MEKGSLSLSVVLCFLQATAQETLPQQNDFDPYLPPIPSVIVGQSYVRRGDNFIHVGYMVMSYDPMTGISFTDDADLGPDDVYIDICGAIQWSDNGAGGEFGYFDSQGNWVAHNGPFTTHYRTAYWDKSKGRYVPIEPKVVRISVCVDDDFDGYLADDPPQWSSPENDGYFTVWEFEIDPPFIDALPQDGATYTFTATIRPEKDHYGNSMARVIEFELDTSAEPGYCMNATREQGLWTDTTAQDNDLKFVPYQPGLEVYADGAHPTNYSIARTVEPVLSASVQVRCLDYGAYGSVSAHAIGLGFARLKGTLIERGAMIPRDENNNGIYDGWIYESRPEGDQDTNPPYGSVGDGVVKYEEYRGFMINGSYFRSDPGQKMLWLVPEEGTTQFASKYGIGFASNLMDAVYQISENWKIEPDSLHPDWPIDRRINWMTRGFYGHTDQNAVRIVDGGYDPFFYGFTSPPIPLIKTPNTTIVCLIFTEAIREDFGQSSDRLNDEEIDIKAIMWQIAHEVGHSVGIPHYPWREGEINSVMAEVPDPPHPVFTNEALIPSEYSDEDKAQMQLH